MSRSSRVLRGVIAIALAIGMVPGVSWAVENQPTDGADVEASALSQSEETQPAETLIVPEEADEMEHDAVDTPPMEQSLSFKLGNTAATVLMSPGKNKDKTGDGTNLV